MKKIKLGTRTSKLALAQAIKVKDLIESTLGYDVEIIGEKSLGDLDQTTQLSNFRGQGVFTSHLEKLLLDKKIDIAVHSLKDLPVQDNPGLELRAYLKRDNPADILIIKKTKLISKTPLQIEPQSRIGTGSPRRQSQILAKFPSTIPLDIRGNVDTRIGKLNSDYIDGVILSSSIFERIEQEIPDYCEKLILPIRDFPTTPGQSTIVVQTREKELIELERINDGLTQQIVTTERTILSTLGGGCELSLGLTISKQNGIWSLIGSRGDDDWNASKSSSLTRLNFTGNDLESLKHQAIDTLIPNVNDIKSNGKLHGKLVLLTKGAIEGEAYINKLSSTGAIVISRQLTDYEINYNLLWDEKIVELWLNTTWITITSQHAVEFLRIINQLYPRTGYKIAVVGGKTAKAVRSIGLPVHIVADGNLESLRNLLSDTRQDSESVLFLSGENITGLPTPDSNRIIVYHTNYKEFELNTKVDYVVVFSQNSANYILTNIGKDFAKIWIAIGKSTGNYLISQNIPTRVSKTPSPFGVIQALMEDES